MKDKRQIALENLSEEMMEASKATVTTLTTECWRSPEPLPFHRRLEGEHLSLQPGDSWGKLFDCAWFRFRGRVQQTDLNRELFADLDFNGEGLVVDAQGRAVRGLTTVRSVFSRSLGEPGKTLTPVTPDADGTVEIWVEAGANDLFGKLQDNGCLRVARIIRRDTPMAELAHDVRMLAGLRNVLPRDGALWRKVDALLDPLLCGSPRAALQAASRESWRREVEAVFGGGFSASQSALRVTAVSHSHLDLAWLWPVRETIRKGIRTCATVLFEMERGPALIFANSQAQLHAWIEEHEPDVHARIVERVREGRWEPLGSMWVEPDTNLPSGESLIRQALHGRAYWWRAFGVRVRGCWLPDTFGYNGNLPQILDGLGEPWLITQKLSWNTHNKFPYHSFRWTGIDGSTIPVHLLPEDTYNGAATPFALAKIERQSTESHIAPEALMCYGIGDGGGGPGEHHLAALRRMAGLPGLPPVRSGRVADFVADWLPHTANLPAYRGELYLEKHQGCFTTRSRIKAWNRRLEEALRRVEILSARAAIVHGVPYPSAALDRLWKVLLLVQFHDILPGTSIPRVYEEAE
ncbi:MAG: alpha-mannosidase, partial [Verrucomicrobiia bacterium]